MEAVHSRRTNDYRIQEAICESGDPDPRRRSLLLPELNNAQNKKIPIAGANEIRLGGARDQIRTGDWPNGQYSLIARTHSLVAAPPSSVGKEMLGLISLRNST